MVKHRRTTAAESQLPGVLNNLTLELEVSLQEKFYLFSSHRVALFATHNGASFNPSSTRQASQQKLSQRSNTPSPQKALRTRPSKLLRWSIRLCQRIDRTRTSVDRSGGSSDGSVTEDEDEEKDVAKEEEKKMMGKEKERQSDRSTAWYVAHVDEKDAKRLCATANVEKWEILEGQLRTAWDQGKADILARQEDKDDDEEDTYTSVRLHFVLDDPSSKSTKTLKREEITIKQEDEIEDNVEGRSLSVEMKRIRGAEMIDESSTAAIEMIKAVGTLKTRTLTLVEERETHRKLLHNTRRHERFKEASSSLVNPGRIKRKLEDDEGFEGEEDAM